MILGGYVYLVDPPKHEQGYQTPVNSLTFSDMGVDGVRYALIKLDGQVTNDSPVVQVDPISVLKKCFASRRTGFRSRSRQ